MTILKLFQQLPEAFLGILRAALGESGEIALGDFGKNSV
jgi:hypothetical protein